MRPRTTLRIALAGIAGATTLLAIPAPAQEPPSEEADPPPYLARPAEEGAPDERAGEAGSDAPGAAEAADAEGEPEEIRLLQVPEPDLAELEPAVAEQLTATRRQLQGLINAEGTDRASAAEAYGELGRLYHAYDFTGAAEPAYVNALQLAPEDHRWAYYLAYLYQQQGKFEHAEALYGRALEIRQTPAAMIHLAEVYLDLERPDDAERVLRHALSGAPELPSAHALLGQVALSRKEYGLAVEYLEAALEAVPEANRLHYPLAMAYRGLGETDQAQEHLEQRGEVGVRPHDPLLDELQELKRGERIHVLRGRTAFRAGDYVAAIEAFRQAVEESPESVPARVNLGSALGQANDRIGAVHHFRKALDVDPDNATAHYNLGVLLGQGGGRDGTHDEALEHLRRAAELEPRDGEIHRELARALERRGRTEEALETYREAAGLAPYDVDGRLGEVQLLVDLGRLEEAFERLDEAHALMPREPRVVNALARFLAGSPEPSLRDGERAHELADRLFEIQPTAAHGETVAMALAQLGRCDEAAAMQRRLVEAHREAGETGSLEALERTLARYEAGPPCRPPGGENG
ncbi:MAG: tetratricopeptide repeat protein [bacterium]